MDPCIRIGLSNGCLCTHANTLYFIQQYLNIKVIVQVKLIWCYSSHSGCHCLTESIIPESNTGAQVWQYLQQSLRDTLEVLKTSHCDLEKIGSATIVS
jgi:hypothetical protein